MNVKILLFIILLPLAGWSQSDKLFTLSGNLTYLSFSQGGAQLPDIFFNPSPYKTTLYIVKYIDSLTIPMVVDTLESDSTGYFSNDLPPGKYGIITSADIGKLKPGQCFPTPFFIESEHMQWSSSWSSNMTFPLDLTKGSLNGLIMDFTSSTICTDCP